jgi:uncharacterized protein (DUF342 family)
VQIQLINARPGMVLLNEVVFPDGKIVLKKGQKLTPEIINAFGKNGINSIDVDGSLMPAQIPSILVRVSSDCFSASLTVEPKGEPDEILTVEVLISHLNRAGVVYGIDEKTLHAVVDQWQIKKHRYEISTVATGRAAEPGKEGPLKMLVKSISSHSDLEKIKSLKLYWQIRDIASQYQKVIPGTIIGEKELAIPPISGCNVKGEPILTDEITKRVIKLDSGVVFARDNNQVLSTITGYAFCIGDLTGAVEVDFNGSVEVVPSADKMSAMMVIHAPGEGGKMPADKEIQMLFITNKISFGLHLELFKSTLFGFTQGIFPNEPFFIAEGIMPQNGVNGKIEFLFNIETSLRPKENPDGSVDYKNVDIINSVAKGEKLVKLIPPTKGVPGKTITGEMVKCIEGAPAKLPIGANTEADPTDPSLLLSSIDGVVRYNGISVEVNEGLIVKGDVDFNTGHINYGKSVIVTGDVKGGFNVECGGDLQIGGVIEDCRIIVGGNVLCKHGLVGQGKGLVEAKGDVNLGFMKNQIVKSRKSVSVAREALNCTIYARNKILIHGNPLSAAGGNLIARDAIVLYTVGNHSGIRTTLEVGIDYTMVEEMEKTDALLIELSGNYTKLVESHSKYNKIIAIKGRLSPQERSLMDKLVESMAKYKQQMSAMEERKKLIQKKMYYFDVAYIKIEKAALPGTLFKFGERHHLVKDELIGPKTIRLIDHEIRIL